MEEKVGYEEGDHLNLTTSGGTSFSQLLYGDCHHHHHHDLDVLLVDDNKAYKYCSSSSSSSPAAVTTTTTSTTYNVGKPPKMLCFGNYSNYERDHDQLLLVTPHNSALACSTKSSSSTSSGNYNTSSGCTVTTTLPNSPANHKKKRNGSVQKSGNVSVDAPAPCPRSSKKSKENNATTPKTAHAKRSKEKLGERITTLQQLVSPFGKTDTASVLHEAMGYISFLHDQVHVLCSPYLQRPSPSDLHGSEEEDGEGKEKDNKDLRSRGLCLVPVECMVHMANSNVADFWPPSSMAN